MGFYVPDHAVDALAALKEVSRPIDAAKNDLRYATTKEKADKIAYDALAALRLKL